MFTYELKKTLCTFYDCVFLHTMFYFEPSARYHINDPIYNKDLSHALTGYSAHMENYLMDYFNSYEEGFRIIESVKAEIFSSKKYLIPGYLSTTATSCVKQLFESPYRSTYDFIGFVDGILLWMPDDLLKKGIYEIARQKGFRIVSRGTGFSK